MYIDKVQSCMIAYCDKYSKINQDGFPVYKMNFIVRKFTIEEYINWDGNKMIRIPEIDDCEIEDYWTKWDTTSCMDASEKYYTRLDNIMNFGASILKGRLYPDKWHKSVYDSGYIYGDNLRSVRRILHQSYGECNTRFFRDREDKESDGLKVVHTGNVIEVGDMGKIHAYSMSFEVSGFTVEFTESRCSRGQENVPVEYSIRIPEIKGCEIGGYQDRFDSLDGTLLTKDTKLDSIMRLGGEILCSRMIPDREFHAKSDTGYLYLIKGGEIIETKKKRDGYMYGYENGKIVEVKRLVNPKLVTVDGKLKYVESEPQKPKRKDNKKKTKLIPIVPSKKK